MVQSYDIFKKEKERGNYLSVTFGGKGFIIHMFKVFYSNQEKRVEHFTEIKKKKNEAVDECLRTGTGSR